ncbi:hypothetical protein FRC01_009810 [Tulasnella sp. 417]|nr:hypothetical protein FRC01_009810 [Tulasnella sp. 417]
MATKEDCDWMELLEAAVDSPVSPVASIQFSRSTSPEGTSSEIIEDNLTPGSSPLESPDPCAKLGVSPYPVTCHRCGSHSTITIPADTLRSAASELLLERARKRKSAALNPTTTAPNKSSTTPQLSTSHLENDQDEGNKSTASSIPSRKKPRLLNEEEIVVLLSAELQDLKASLLRAEELARKYQKYEFLYLKAMDQKPAKLIPRPEGERGKNGWTLLKALQLESKPDLYLSILASVRQAITSAGLDWEKTFHKQNSVRVAECFRIIKENNPYLEQFEDDWPARELVVSCMQNKRKTRNRKSNSKADNVPGQAIIRVSEDDDGNGYAEESREVML